MHTFSPAKNWIRGTQLLNKPLLHLATQFLNHIPYKTIDFDYMNVNQSAHGDREYAFINARLKKNNKIIFGHWEDDEIRQQIAKWMNVAVAYNESYKIKIVTFADKMRDVAVTDGDKVEAQIKFGWTVDYWGVGDLVEYVNAVAESDINQLYKDLQSKYDYIEGNNSSEKFEKNVKYQHNYFWLMVMDSLEKEIGKQQHLSVCSKLWRIIKKQSLWKIILWICVKDTKQFLGHTCLKLILQ